MKLNDAIRLLNQASAVIITNEPGNPLIYPSIMDDEGEVYFLNLSWTDDTGEYEVGFKATDNEEVETKNNQLLLKNDNGDIYDLQLLSPMTVE